MTNYVNPQNDQDSPPVFVENLKVLAKINPGDTISFTREVFEISPHQSWSTAVWRYYNGEDRRSMLDKIRTCLYEAMAQINRTLPRDRILIKLMDEALTGIENLKVTYQPKDEAEISDFVEDIENLVAHFRLQLLDIFPPGVNFRASLPANVQKKESENLEKPKNQLPDHSSDELLAGTVDSLGSNESDSSNNPDELAQQKLTDGELEYELDDQLSNELDQNQTEELDQDNSEGHFLYPRPFLKDPTKELTENPASGTDSIPTTDTGQSSTPRSKESSTSPEKSNRPMPSETSNAKTETNSKFTNFTDFIRRRKRSSPSKQSEPKNSSTAPLIPHQDPGEKFMQECCIIL